MSPLRIVPLTEEYLGEAALLGSRQGKSREARPAPARKVRGFRRVAAADTSAHNWAPSAAALVDGDRLVGFMTTVLVEELRGPYREFLRGRVGPCGSRRHAGRTKAVHHRRMYEPLERNGSSRTAASPTPSPSTLTIKMQSTHGSGRTRCAASMRCGGSTLSEPLCTMTMISTSIRPRRMTWMPSYTSRNSTCEIYGGISLIHACRGVEGLRKRYEEWLSGESHIMYLAFRNDKPIAYMQWEPSYDGASYIITDPKTASINGAFTLEEHFAGASVPRLLDEVLRAARAGGFERCSVDFESHNIYGSRFWLRYFQPICYSVFRQVDERIACAPRPQAGHWPGSVCSVW